MQFISIITLFLLVTESYAATKATTVRKAATTKRATTRIRTRIRTHTKTTTAVAIPTTTGLLLPSGLFTDLSASVMAVNGATSTFLVEGGIFDDDVAMTVVQGPSSAMVTGSNSVLSASQSCKLAGTTSVSCEYNYRASDDPDSTTLKATSSWNGNVAPAYVQVPITAGATLLKTSSSTKNAAAVPAPQNIIKTVVKIAVVPATLALM